MAEQLDPKDLVSFKGLLMANSIQADEGWRERVIDEAVVFD
jgi:hypothetical protein